MTDIATRVDALLPALIALRRELHTHPELGFKEVQTARRIEEQLRRIPGIRMRTGLAGTGIVATFGADKPGPCIALRAELDALPIQEQSGLPYASTQPGVMHACGHDGHMACLVGAALVLGQIQDELPGPVKFVFQPAEEMLGGALRMIAAGALEQPAVAAMFGCHCYAEAGLACGGIGVTSGPALAADCHIDIEVRGMGTHASAPHLAVDPILTGARIVSALQALITRGEDPLASVALSITQFNAGVTRNVISDRAVLSGTLRILAPERIEAALARVRRIAEETAAAAGATVAVRTQLSYPVLVNDPACAYAVVRAARTLLPDAQVQPQFPPLMVSEDFAYYAQRVPAALWFVGLREAAAAAPGLHHPQFDFNDAVIKPVVMLHCGIARQAGKPVRQ